MIPVSPTSAEKGDLNLALLDTPSANPAVLPARMRIAPNSVALRMRLLPASATTKSPAGPTLTLSRLKKTAAPVLVMFQMHGGSAVIPGLLQLGGVAQGWEGAGNPPGQKLPALQRVALAALTEPAEQP